jgi:hypothetical protein
MGTMSEGLPQIERSITLERICIPVFLGPVMACRNRAIALDQFYLDQLSDYQSKIVFALNQCDLVEPLDWRDTLNIPSREQERNIQEILLDRTSKLCEIVQENPRVVYYSGRKEV